MSIKFAECLVHLAGRLVAILVPKRSQSGQGQVLLLCIDTAALIVTILPGRILLLSGTEMDSNLLEIGSDIFAKSTHCTGTPWVSCVGLARPTMYYYLLWVRREDIDASTLADAQRP